ncbi:uncharacterized protein LOC129966808 isoform X2 [Argiope bruennichi]|uniref:Uncharacterized protein n=1 Tax=Argiope bruennichi TaxID=94029 RepID=A0A8T0E7Q7_ARGBR|nr:uncharacterized protein LOC129966808 isoform X2 [Argiope bruennichi]KAF8767418.1 hypothetical protein HNY73_020383 [Argiope bruennichi]
MASESQKKEFAAAREELSGPSTTKLDESAAAQVQQNVLNKLRERFADLFLTDDADQRNHDIYYCLVKGMCKEEEKKLVSCFMRADAAGADVSESCNEEILEMKTCINKCLFKLTEKKLDLMLLLSHLKNCIHH